MALIEARGYVNKPATKGSDKKFATFTLAERQKDRNGEYYKVFYNVADFSTETPPEESAFVTVKGYLNAPTVEKDGKKYTNLNITAREIEVAPKREGSAPAVDDSFDF